MHDFKIMPSNRMFSGDAETQPETMQVDGKSLSISITRLSKDEVANGDAACEEVGAVVEGSFRLELSDEEHTLSTGEGAMIGTSEPRRWQCVSDQGVLYRVVRKADQDQADS